DPNEMNWSAYATRSKRWDYALSANEYSSQVWRKNSPYYYRILETGYPRNDVLFNHSEAFVDQIRQRLRIESGRNVALYAPTFRPEEKGTTKDFNNFQLASPSQIQQALGDDWIVLVRGHYFVGNVE